MLRRTTLRHVQEYHNPSSPAIKALLSNMKVLVVLGMSTDPSRPSYHVIEEMLNRPAHAQHPFDVIPVRPLTKPIDILGFPAKSSLKEIDPEILRAPTTIVDVFRKSSDVPAIMNECLSLGVANVWLQKGVIDHAAATAAAEKGVVVIQDLCIFREHQRLLPQEWE